MKKNKKSLHEPMLNYLSEATDSALKGKDWASILKSINSSIASGLSSNYTAIFWKYDRSPSFEVLVENGSAGRVRKRFLDKDKLPSKWIKQNKYETLLSQSNIKSGRETKILQELKSDKSNALVVPISAGKNLKGFIFSQQKRDGGFDKTEIRFVESIASILALAHERERLGKANRDLEKIPNINPDLIMKFNKSGDLLYINPAVEKVLKAYKIGKKNINKILPPSHARRMELAFKNEENITADAIIGSSHYEFTYNPILDDETLIILGKDVSDRQEALNKLLHSQSRLIESNNAFKELYDREKQIRSQLVHTEQLAALGQMGSKIAHELNNPLQVISACAEVISDLIEDESINEIVEDMNTEIQHIISLASGYMRLGKPTLSKRKNINVNNVIKELVETLKTIGQMKTVKLTLDLGKRLPKVNVDKDKLDQVFRNLILNALQAMQGRKTQNLVISTLMDDERKFVVTKIYDTGTGIPKNDLPKIFDPYFTTKQEDVGTGIGLLIVKDIIEVEYKGKIDVISTKGKGSTFSVSLSVAKGEPVSAKILIVDDEPMLCQSYRRFLTKSGYNVETAMDGKSALKVFDQFSPDVIIADIQMPGMDGFQFAEQIWKKTPNQKIIFSSGFAYVEDIKNKLERDNLMFFKKPARLVEDLLHSVTTALKSD
ncbi:MAG: response regulator [Candidatus Marinimicrobia bacterium]|nr:response regulator [Candidatus Neomarinimicrobiota bacterium]